ncbi:MAG TPA: homocysteine S-methyltransferase family protein, partial [Kiloniellaceae bacterium]
MADRLTELLETRPWLLADGATGTNFFAMGLQHGDAPELWNLAQPDDVVRHYRSFIDAGSDIVLTNSFGGTANRLKLHKADDRVFEINQAAAALARRAAEEAKAESGRDDVIVAGSVGPTGDLFEPLGPLTVEQGAAAFEAQARGLA